MRKPFVCGNWKLHLTRQAASELARSIVTALPAPTIDVAIAPSFTSLDVVRQVTADSAIGLAAQNCYWREQGAFTGEISPMQLRDAGCHYVIVGHSERRQLFAETDEHIAKKIVALLAEHLQPIVCVGETDAERENQQTFARIAQQTRRALEGLSAAQLLRVTLAYEPVWAIGTGKVATPVQAQEVHFAIRSILGEIWGKEIASQVRIQYGGSVKPENIGELIKQPDIDGALVGGAALSSDDFVKICRAVQGA